jgi:cephalosporin hydroxylase
MPGPSTEVTACHTIRAMPINRALSMRAVRHPESWIELDQAHRVPLPYLPTYSGFGERIDDGHRALAAAPVKGPLIDLGIPGWLRIEDALKLYELAYFCVGDILELGTHQGLSTYIMASALASSGKNNSITTVDLDPAASNTAKRNLVEERDLGRFVNFIVAEGSAVLGDLTSQKRQFGMAFVDHSHTYEAVERTCHYLPQLISPGGFVAFHDFVDARNTRRKHVGDVNDEYGIYSAVEDALGAEFEFYGCYGCCGVFRRT